MPGPNAISRRAASRSKPKSAARTYRSNPANYTAGRKARDASNAARATKRSRPAPTKSGNYVTDVVPQWNLFRSISNRLKNPSGK